MSTYPYFEKSQKKNTRPSFAAARAWEADVDGNETNTDMTLLLSSLLSPLFYLSVLSLAAAVRMVIFLGLFPLGFCPPTPPLVRCFCGASVSVVKVPAPPLAASTERKQKGRHLQPCVRAGAAAQETNKERKGGTPPLTFCPCRKSDAAPPWAPHWPQPLGMIG